MTVCVSKKHSLDPCGDSNGCAIIFHALIASVAGSSILQTKHQHDIIMPRRHTPEKSILEMRNEPYMRVRRTGAGLKGIYARPIL